MACGEEIINGREITENEMTMRRACAGQSYYHLEHSREKVDALQLGGVKPQTVTLALRKHIIP